MICDQPLEERLRECLGYVPDDGFEKVKDGLGYGMVYFVWHRDKENEGHAALMNPEITLSQAMFEPDDHKFTGIVFKPEAKPWNN